MHLGWNELILICIALCVLIPFILFLILQQNVLKSISHQNRTISPGEVFLQLIPLFGMIWQFVVVSRISASIHKELSNEQTFSFETTISSPLPHAGYRPTYAIGIAYCVLFCCSIIPMLTVLTSLAGLVCWIIYWVKLAEYKNMLQQKRLAVTPGAI